MSVNSDVLSRLSHVDGVFHYLAPMAEKPRNFTYDPPPGVERTNAAYEPHAMPVYDVRPIASELSVDGEGIELLEHRSAVHGFEDEEEIRQVYYPEAERLVAAATGASRVVVFDHTIRRRQAGAVDRAAGTPRQPVTRVAVCGGAGDSLLSAEAVRTADVYVTADLRHHPASEAREQAVLGGGPALLDVSHWASEWLWLDTAAEQLRAALPGVEVVVSELRTDPWDFAILQ